MYEKFFRVNSILNYFADLTVRGGPQLIQLLLFILFFSGKKTKQKKKIKKKIVFMNSPTNSLMDML